MTTATPLRPAYWEDVERQLDALFYDLLFRPLVDVLKANMGAAAGSDPLRNAAEDELMQALQTGRIQYADGVFYGKFSAALSKALRAIGATFDKRRAVYKMDAARVPGWVRSAAGVYQAKARDLNKALVRALDDVQVGLDEALGRRTISARVAIAGIKHDWKSVAKRLELSPELSPASEKRLFDGYNRNIMLSVKKFSHQMVQEMRGVVEENAHQGYRFAALIQDLQGRYGVSKSKAKFLARQETSLFMSKFRRERFQEAGVTQYTWRTSMDERVRHDPGPGHKSRPDHRHLEGKVFSYDNPPVIDFATGRRANPGEDYQCRCIDEPVLVPVRQRIAA